MPVTRRWFLGSAALTGALGSLPARLARSAADPARRGTRASRFDDELPLRHPERAVRCAFADPSDPFRAADDDLVNHGLPPADRARLLGRF